MRRTLPLLLVLALSAACSGGDGGASPATAAVTAAPGTTGPPTTVPPTTATPAEPATFEVRPGVEQITVTGAEPGATLEVVARDGTVLATGTADDGGGLVQRGLPGGDAVAVRSSDAVSVEVTVMARGDAMPPEFYAEQRLPTEGLGYIETRDGTTLSGPSVWLPPAGGRRPLSHRRRVLRLLAEQPRVGGLPRHPERARVRVRRGQHPRHRLQRGSFRYFEYTQSTDGYDAVEVVAAQPWVLGNRVGGRRVVSGHQPAVRRPDTAAEPRCDHAVQRRRGPDLVDALPPAGS